MKNFLANAPNVDKLAKKKRKEKKKKRIDASNKNMLSCKKDISTYNINRPTPKI